MGSDDGQAALTGDRRSGATRPPWWFWLVGAVCLLWTAFAVYDVAMTYIVGEAYLRTHTTDQRLIDYALGMPGWMKAVGAIGSLASFLGAALLLLRSRLATTAFAVALTAMGVSLIHTFILSNGADSLGDAGAAIIGFSVAQSLALYVFAVAMAKRGVIG